MNSIRKIKLALVALVSTFSFSAHAQWVVVDPTNLIQNLATAISSVANEINTAATYAEQVKSTIEMVKSTASMDGLSSLAGLNQQYSLYQNMANNGTQMNGLLNQSLQATRDLQAQFGSSNVSWDTYLQNRSAANNNRSDALAQQYTYLNQSLEDTANRRKEILNSLQGATGQTSATQAVGAQLDVVIGQQQQMVSELSRQKQMEANKIRTEEADKAAYIEYNHKYQQSLRNSTNRLRDTYAD